MIDRRIWSGSVTRQRGKEGEVKDRLCYLLLKEIGLSTIECANGNPTD